MDKIQSHLAKTLPEPLCQLTTPVGMVDNAAAYYQFRDSALLTLGRFAELYGNAVANIVWSGLTIGSSALFKATVPRRRHRKPQSSESFHGE